MGGVESVAQKYMMLGVFRNTLFIQFSSNQYYLPFPLTSIPEVFGTASFQVFEYSADKMDCFSGFALIDLVFSSVLC